MNGPEDEKMMQDPEDQTGADQDFLKDFIERKKLENRVLQKIIDNIQLSEPLSNKETTNNDQTK